MTKEDWLSVALKTVGVVLVIVYLGGLLVVGAFILERAFGDQEFQKVVVASPVFSLGAMVVGVVVAILLVTDGDVLARRLAPKEEEDEDVPDVGSQRALFLVAVKAIGVVCVARALPGLLSRIGSALARQDWVRTHFFSSAPSLWLRELIWPLVLLAIGLWLIFGGKLLMRMAFGHVSTSSEDLQPLSWKPSTLFSVALRVLGVVFLTVKLPWLIKVLVIRVFPITAEWQHRADLPLRFDWEGFLSGLLILAVSVYLITGAKHFVRLVFKKDAPAMASDHQGGAP